jgi:hypothetical protein
MKTITVTPKKGIGLHVDYMLKGKPPVGQWVRIKVKGTRDFVIGRFKAKIPKGSMPKHLKQLFLEYNFLGLAVDKSIGKTYTILKLNGYAIYYPSKKQTSISFGNMAWSLFEVGTEKEAIEKAKQLARLIGKRHVR